jgi:hypothetical protein
MVTWPKGMLELFDVSWGTSEAAPVPDRLTAMFPLEELLATAS